MLVVAGLVGTRTVIAEGLIAQALRQQGLGHVSLSVTRLGPGGIVIEDLSAEGGALHVERIALSYDMPSAFRGRFKNLDIANARAHLSWTDAGVRLGAWPVALRPDAGPLILPHFDRITAPNIALSVETPTATLLAPLSLSAEPVDGGWNTVLNGMLEGPGAKILAEWSGVISPDDLTRWAGSGKFELAVDSLNVPGITEWLNADGVATITARDGDFMLSFDKALTLDFAPLMPQAAQTSSFLASLERLPTAITITSSGQDPALIASVVEGRRRVRFDLDVGVRAGDGRLQFVARGETSQGGNQPAAVAVDAFRAEIATFPFGPSLISGSLDVRDVTGAPGDLHGRLVASTTVRGLAAASLSATRLDAAASGPFHVDRNSAALTLEAFTLSAEDAALAEWAALVPLRLTLAPRKGEPHRISVDLSDFSVSGDVAVAIPEFSLQAGDAPEAAPLTVRVPHLRIAGDLSPGDRNVTLAARDISVRHAFAEARSVNLDIAAKGADISGTAAFEVARLGAVTESPPNSALSVSSTLRSRASGFDLRGALSASGVKLGDFTATASADGRTGNAGFSMPQTAFARGGKVDPAVLSFVTAVSDLTGGIGLDLKTAWSPKGRTESAVLTLADVSFAAGEISVAGLSTTIDLNALWPLRSAQPVKLTATSIDAGLPLTDLQADITLPGDDTAVIGTGTLNVAGGQIAVRDAVIPLTGRPTTLSLDVRSIDMAQLAALAEVDGLSVTGTLSGTVPMHEESAEYYFDDGLLRANGPGRLIYKPATPPAALSQSQGGNLLLQALSNFSYDRLSITVSGPLTEDINLAVALAGKNPDLYGGYPIEFNLNLSGRLTQILRQGLIGYGLPADIERQIREGKPAGP